MPESTARSATAHLPSSPLRFPDGAQYRFEVPSVEGPECLEAALEEAARLDVPIHRLSQGSGVFLQTDRELTQMAERAAAARVELSLFARPVAGWTVPGLPNRLDPRGFGSVCVGVDGIADALADVERAAAHGFRSVLISDLGLLSECGRRRRDGRLPADMQAKVSVMLPIANPATAAVLVGLGASTLNLVPFLTLAQIAEVRAQVDVPLDIYVEGPDDIGGHVRIHEVAELIRVAAPVYVKFGLRNAPDVYPAGSHLRATTVALTRERVRRARLGLELLRRSGADPLVSAIGADGLAIPVPVAAARDGAGAVAASDVATAEPSTALESA